jgi:hypothetical protein
MKTASDKFFSGRESKISHYLDKSPLSKKFSREQLDELKSFLLEETPYQAQLRQIRSNLMLRRF